MEKGKRFYVRVPAGQNPEWRVKHADETVNVMAGYFKSPNGIIIPEADGTYEVIALAPSTVSIVRQMLTDHEGLEIIREEDLTGTISDMIISQEEA